MSTLLDDVINDLQSSGPPESAYQGGDDYQHHQGQGQQQQQDHSERSVGQRRVHFEDESEDESFIDKFKGVFKADSMKTPLAVLFAVLLASLPQINDLVEKIPYISDNWMASATFKAVVLAVMVYFLKLH